MLNKEFLIIFRSHDTHQLLVGNYAGSRTILMQNLSLIFAAKLEFMVLLWHPQAVLATLVRSFNIFKHSMRVLPKKTSDLGYKDDVSGEHHVLSRLLPRSLSHGGYN